MVLCQVPPKSPATGVDAPEYEYRQDGPSPAPQGRDASELPSPLEAESDVLRLAAIAGAALNAPPSNITPKAKLTRA